MMPAADDETSQNSVKNPNSPIVSSRTAQVQRRTTAKRSMQQFSAWQPLPFMGVYGLFVNKPGALPACLMAKMMVKEKQKTRKRAFF